MINEMNAQQILVDLMCIFLLVYSYIKIRSNKSFKFPYVNAFIVFNILANLFELLIALNQGELLLDSSASYYVLQNGYNCSALIACGCWFVNSLHITNSELYTKKILLSFTIVPLIALLVLTLTTSKHHLVFFINEFGKYQRGELFVIFFLAAGLYVLAALCFYIYADNNKHFYIFKKLNRLAAIYSLFLLMCMVAQIAAHGLMSLINTAAAIIALMIHEDFQQKEITVDALTGLNNRNAINDKILKVLSSKQRFNYIVALDVDTFKMINDTYGHVEGDESLIAVADALRSVVSEKSFYGRIGGDEFLILTDENEDEITSLEERINNKIEDILCEKGKKYIFTVSAGIHLLDNTFESIPDILSSADKKLYARKNEKKHSNTNTK